jgi:cytochrome P450
MATTGAAATNILLDILAADADLRLYETLRVEAESVFKSEADWTSPASMKKLVNMDSTIRESLRINPLQSRGLLKEVAASEGVLLPDGAHVPQGTWLGVPLQAMQLDERLDANARTYDPLRFARLRATACDGDSGNKSLLDAAQPSDQYLSFSYGRSAW